MDCINRTDCAEGQTERVANTRRETDEVRKRRSELPFVDCLCKPVPQAVSASCKSTGAIRRSIVERLSGPKSQGGTAVGPKGEDCPEVSDIHQLGEDVGSRSKA